jgi:hypothetical protein
MERTSVGSAEGPGLGRDKKEDAVTDMQGAGGDGYARMLVKKA